MQLKDATRIFGRVVLLLPLILFLIAVDPAFACPGHNNGVAYRTRALKNRMVSGMSSTVITYRAPASYGRCGDNLYDTRRVRYVAARGNGYQNGARYVAVRGGSTRYVAIREAELPRFGRARYGAVYDVDYGIARREARAYVPRTRYVAVRNVDLDDVDDVRYVAVRRAAPRVRYVAVRDVDYEDIDAPRYVAVRRYPRIDNGTSYVAVRNANDYYDRTRTRYVAVRNTDTGCPRAVALRSCLDQIETTSARRVVVRNDDGYSTGTRYVAVRNDMDDDDEYIALPSENVNTTKYVVDYDDTANSSGNGDTYIAASDMVSPCARQVAVRDCQEAVGTGTISYRPVSYDEDFDDQAYLDGGGATYVAADDIEDACLRPVAVRAPIAVREVSYVPVDNVDEDAFLSGSEPTRFVTEVAATQPRYVALDDDRVFDDLDPTWVAAQGLDNTYLQPVAVSGYEDDMGARTVSFVPVDNVDNVDTETVSYVPVDDVDDTYVNSVSYVPVDTMAADTVTYVPAESVSDVDTTYVTANDCPAFVSSVDSEPVYVADASTDFVDAGFVAGLRGTQTIAANYGYRDGFEDGRDAAREGDVFHPENSGDYQKTTEGYEDAYGDKDVYKNAYRDTYLQGYQAGFESAVDSV